MKNNNLLPVTSMSAMAQHDHHDQLLTAWLVGTGNSDQHIFPMVFWHCEAVNNCISHDEPMMRKLDMLLRFKIWNFKPNIKQ